MYSRIVTGHIQIYVVIIIVAAMVQFEKSYTIPG